MASPGSSGPSGVVETFASRLRFPQLFAVALTVFLIDLVVPDLIPFADEILLGLVTLLLGSLRERRPEPTEASAMKDVTPRR
jgi:hypothetical protein